MRAGWAGRHGGEQENRESKASNGVWKAESGTKWGLGKIPNWDLQPSSGENSAKPLGLVFNLLQPMENHVWLGCTFPKFWLWKTLSVCSHPEGKTEEPRPKSSQNWKVGGRAGLKLPGRRIMVDT